MSQSVKMFFQVILPSTLQLGKLEIPIKFVRLYGETFLSGMSIILRAPNGDTWPVALEKNDNGSVTMGKGWTKFADHYSMDAMDFIVFKYKCHRKSSPVFNVLILKDSTNMEITHYPKKFHNFKKRQAIFKQGRCYMGVPISFLRKTGLCNKATLVLKGESGMECEVRLKHRVVNGFDKKRYHLGLGWKAFRKNNHIANTDNLKFQHIHGSLIQVTKVV